MSLLSYLQNASAIGTRINRETQSQIESALAGHPVTNVRSDLGHLSIQETLFKHCPAGTTVNAIIPVLAGEALAALEVVTEKRFIQTGLEHLAAEPDLSSLRYNVPGVSIHDPFAKAGLVGYSFVLQRGPEATHGYLHMTIRDKPNIGEGVVTFDVEN